MRTQRTLTLTLTLSLTLTLTLTLTLNQVGDRVMAVNGEAQRRDGLGAERRVGLQRREHLWGQ